MERDEYLLHTKPLHDFRSYVTAHALAGNLKLATDKAKQPPKAAPSYEEFHAKKGRK